MKKKITLITALLLSFLGVKADVIPSEYYSEPAEGTFYLYNVTQQKFLTGDPSMIDSPASLTLAEVDDVKYSISPATNQFLKMGHWRGQFLWNNGWADSPYFKWAFAVANTKTYRLHIDVIVDNTEDGYTFLAETSYYLNTVRSITPTESEADEWALITPTDYDTYLANTASVEENKATIIAAKGDATSLIQNPTFDSSDVGWSGGNRTGCTTWRGGNYDYESTSTTTFTQILYGMPAGTYKLVAAVRGEVNTSVTAKLNGTAGETIYNAQFQTNRPLINTNGVQMPYSSLGGFRGEWNANGWQWATVTYTLAADGDLTIAFDMAGNAWKGIDDVHLYYMSDGTTEYAQTYYDGIDNVNHAVTCDLKADENPNKIFRTSTGQNITTAAGQILINCWNTSNWFNNLYLYDGYEFTMPAGTYYAVNSRLYREVTAGAFATVCAPFPINGGNGVDGTFYQPESLTTGGILNFEAVSSRAAGAAYLYKATSRVTYFDGAANQQFVVAPVDNGSGVVMKGTFSNIATVDHDDYVLSGTNLYKVDGDVSLAPFRAYFNIPESADVKANMIALNFDETVTGIDAVQSSDKQQGVVYNLAGQRVMNPTHGIYIVNGKKVYFK